MRQLIGSLLLVTLSFIYKMTFSQTLNWKAMDSAKRVINANFGADYSLASGISYGYKLRTTMPLVLNANFYLPAGENALDDFKTKLGGQICLWKRSNFAASVSLLGVYRVYRTQLVRLQNFGTDVKGTFGYYKRKGFFALEAGFDKAIVTRFKHTQKYKEDIYADVVDGWYQPPTGGNVYYGLQAGCSFKKLDISLNIGRVISQDFKTLPLLPFYLNLGINYRIRR